MTRLVNRGLSLEELERDRGSVPSDGDTRLMATVRELRRKPIGSLTVEDLRFLIRQDVGLASLLPLAVEVLRANPLAEGDVYAGDLLAAVLTRSADVWSGFPELGREVRLIVSELTDVPPALERDIEGFLALCGRTLESHVSARRMLDAYGLRSIVYVPRTADGSACDGHSANLLSSVGLPHSDVFISRNAVPGTWPESGDTLTLGGHAFPDGWSCPVESRSWWVLGYLFASLVALDPASGKVYAFPEGEGGYHQLHRDVDSLLFTLVEFRRLENDHDADVDPEELSARFRRVVGAVDPTPFVVEDSAWNVALEELEHGIW
ncbi:contact-dependent growth inhibition system immunity protein [Streptomyces sp. NPDC058955]|uniref:contact-dependent growth inhibition system immunity protein n=1 Tax=unclassified Streptomyces TaxID=2593676 RepID=UPI003650086E